MHRVIVLLISLLLVSSEVKAYTNEKIYSWCKPLVAKAFKYQDHSDVGCIVAVDTVVQSAIAACLWSKQFEVSHDYLERNASGEVSAKAAAQAFVNWAAKNPKKWDVPLSASIGEWLTNMWPCE